MFKSTLEKLKDVNAKKTMLDNQAKMIQGFVDACKQVIEKGVISQKNADENIEKEIEENLKEGTNNKEKGYVDKFLDLFKPNDVFKNAFKDKDIIEQLGNYLKDEVEKLSNIETIKKFFDNTVMNKITKEYYSKYKKFFNFKTLVNKFKEHCKFNDKIKLNKAGALTRKALYQDKTLEAWLAIFGPAWKDKTKNKQNIEKFLSRDLKKIREKLNKYSFWDGLREMDSEELKEIFGGQSLYQFISKTIGDDIKLFPIILLSGKNAIKLELRTQFLAIINKIRKSISEENRDFDNADIILNVKALDNKTLKVAAQELVKKLKDVCKTSVDIEEATKVLEKKEEKDINKQSDNPEKYQEMKEMKEMKDIKQDN